MIDMTIALDYAIQDKVYLLDGISVDMVDPYWPYAKQYKEDTAMILDGSYKPSVSEYLQAYKSSDSLCALAKEGNVSAVVMNEKQIVDWSTYTKATSSDKAAAETIIDNPPTAPIVQLIPEEHMFYFYGTKEISAFNEKSKKIHVLFEFERDSLSNAKTMLSCINGQSLFPLNDLLDVCVKSQFKKTSPNSMVPADMRDQSLNKNVDVYFSFDEYPVSFCQCNNDAFALSQPTTKQLYFLKGSMLSDLQQSKFDVPHTFSVKRDELQTVLYKTPSEVKSGATTYNAALLNQKMTPEKLADVFEPKRHICGIDYSYVVGIDQNNSESKKLENKTIYENGDIFGSFSLTKSMYNANYTMEMPNLTSMYACRQYCGIQNTQNKVLLKYYDSIDYTFSNSPGQYAMAKKKANSKYGGKLYPYQKVEFYMPTKVGISARHKSNLFSINIFNSGLDDEYVEKHVIDKNNGSQTTQQKNFVSQVKRDIMNGVKALAESIAPANTQLFKVFYQSS